MAEKWWPPNKIVFTRDQCLFLIRHIELLREGCYPPECAETGYTGSRGQVGHHAPFETPVLLAAEIDYRLKRCGIAGALLAAQVCGELYPLHPDAALALRYVSGWWRKRSSFMEWRRQVWYRGNYCENRSRRS